MISNKLLTLVLNTGFTITNHNLDTTSNVPYMSIYVKNEELIYDSINIHQLAYLCKQWCYTKGYTLYSYYSLCDEGIEHSDCKVWLDSCIVFSLCDTDIPATEPEAIILATQWCYKQIQLKD